MNFADESIAAARDRIDVAGAVFFFAQRFAQQPDILRETRVGDDRVRPDLRHQCFARDDPSSVLDEHEQRLEDFRRQRNDFAVAEKLSLVGIGDEWTKGEACTRLVRLGGGHG